jgi:methyl-accepting chemotaxis protein
MANNIESTLSQSMTSVLRDMQESMSGEVDAIRSQTAQVEALLKDAIASLHQAFEAIHSASEQQMQTMTALMMDVTGAKDENNIFQKAENSSEILTHLVDALLLSSKNNLRALTAMDVMQKRMNTMLCNEGEQRDLIGRIGDCSEAAVIDAEMLRGLVTKLRDKQSEHLDYASETVAKFVKAHRLIDTIASKDMSEVFAAKEKVEEILTHFFQINEIVTESRVQVNQVNADMRKHLGSAIRALQFEDISTQSLGHTDRHLGRMAGMIAILTDGLDGLDQPDITMEVYISRIAAIHAAMAAYHQTLQLEDSNPVSQESMDEGDIDLF